MELFWLLFTLFTTLVFGISALLFLLIAIFLFLSWSEMSWITPTSQVLGLAAQNKLLKHFVRTPFEVKVCNSLNYVEFKTRSGLKPPNREERVLVLMHGYGSGLGFFFGKSTVRILTISITTVNIDNYDALSTYFDRVIAVDWHGMGLSSRTEKPITRLSMFHMLCKQDKDKVLHVARTVTNEFIDSLEQFRIAANIPRFVLAGHSLGGFLSAKYALKYPSHLEALILISPVGIPHPPSKEDLVDPSDLDWKYKLIDNMWKMNFTPQNIVRVLGPKGPGVVTNMLNRRFSSRWSGEDLALISDYFYHVTAAPGSGEYALNALLEPKIVRPLPREEEAAALVSGRPRTGVYAREPLEQDLCRLSVPVLLMYGDHDWLAYPGVEKSVDLWRKNGVKSEYVVIPQAGHHLYNDNSPVFNNAIIDWAKRSAYLTEDSITSDSNSVRVTQKHQKHEKKSNLIDNIYG